MAEQISQPAAPWWRFAHVWLVLSGPAVVVVASFITLYLAITRPEVVVSAEARAPGVQQSVGAAAGQGPGVSQAPAMLARNHAATGQVPERP